MSYWNQKKTLELKVYIFVQPVQPISQYQKYHNTLCFYFLLGLAKIPKETWKNAYAKFWLDKKRVLWYFWYWLMVLALDESHSGIKSLPEGKLAGTNWKL